MPADAVRRLAFFVAVVAASFTSFFLVTLAQVWLTGRDDSFASNDSRVDAIVVLGAAQYDGRPSPQLRARLDHALLLWRKSSAERLIVTGGKQSADRFTEAQASREYLIQNGVPDAAIVVEPQGESTYQSLSAVKATTDSLTVRRIVVVSDPYHVLRAQLVAREVGFTTEVSATRSSVVRGGAALRRNIRESLGIMVGRITGFQQLEAWLQ